MVYKYKVQYKCSFCKYITDTEKDIETHLSSCVFNPDNLGCGSCGNIYWGDQDESGRTFCNEECKEYPNVISCISWVRKNFSY